MSGYTPLFSTLTTGTLCGRWPDIGLWPIVLSMADRHGVVDVTPAYLSSVTGLPLPEVIACMKRFCEPDPYSRSADNGGARLALLDAHRDWGWHIVNHGKYREKARKSANDAERAASGKNAQRMAERRSGPDATREDPTRPAKTRSDPPSDSDSDSDSDEELNPCTHTARARASSGPEPEPLLNGHATLHVEHPGHPPGENLIGQAILAIKATYPKGGREDWLSAEHSIRRLIDLGNPPLKLESAVSRYAASCAHTGRTPMNPANFFSAYDKPWLQEWAIPKRERVTPPRQRAKTVAELEAEEAARGSAGSP